MIQKGRQSREQWLEIRRKFPGFSRREEEVSAPPQFYQPDGDPAPILMHFSGEVASGVVCVRNPTRLALKIHVLWLIIGERRWSRAICLRRRGDDRVCRTIKLNPKEEVVLEFIFLLSDCPGGEGGVWFACDNRLEHFSVQVKIPESGTMAHGHYRVPDALPPVPELLSLPEWKQTVCAEQKAVENEQTQSTQNP